MLRCCTSTTWLLACSFSLWCLLLVANVAIVTVVKAEKVVALFGMYPARAAGFGMEIMAENETINVMYPPVNSTVSVGPHHGGVSHTRNVRALCEYTGGMLPDDDLVPANDAPIAFLVDIRGCSAQKQAQVAAKMQSVLSSKIKYIILQGLPDLDYLQVLKPDKFENSLESLASIGILYVTYQTGLAIKQRIKRIWAAGLSPFFMDPSGWNRQWVLITGIEQFNGGEADAGAGFYWFYILLFTLLIVAPCLRALQLWWLGGGRIRFRRDDRGRIRGLQCVAPAPYWLSRGLWVPGRQGGGAAPRSDYNNNESRSSTLSEEQFSELPETIFKPNKAVATAVAAEAADPEDEHHQQEADKDKEPEILVVSGEEEMISLDEKCPDSPEVELNVVDENSTSAEEEEKAADDGSSHQAEAVSTSCTTCSICINDFVPGEKLTLLPRCRHAFHRGCIHPWLTERQGCCPSCKASVLEMHGEDDDKQAAEAVAEREAAGDLEEAIDREGEEGELELVQHRQEPEEETSRERGSRDDGNR